MQPKENLTYKLVIAEKTSVAQSIAKVIGADKREDGYLEGKHTAICGKEQKRFIRFRFLGEDYTEENLKKIIAGEKELPEKKEKVSDQKVVKSENGSLTWWWIFRRRWHRERMVVMSAGRKNIM